MIILGVDPGTAITGYGIIKNEGNRFRCLGHGVISTNPELDMAASLNSIHLKLSAIIEEYQPAHMAVEQLFFCKNTKTALSIGQARGVILLTGMQKSLTIAEYTPLQVKQSVVGYGRAEKSQVQKMVTYILGLNSMPHPDDAADALAIAICHAHSHKLKTLIAGNRI
ncbi:MAG: crossover junction endodeoxyribonuclease RuvC [Bacillota bacterium]